MVQLNLFISRGRRGRMVVGFTTNCAISAYQTNVVSLNPVHGEVYSIQHYVIILLKVVLNVIVGQLLSPGTPVSSTNKTDRHNITEILLKVALDTLNPKPPLQLYFNCTAHIAHLD